MNYLHTSACSIVLAAGFALSAPLPALAQTMPSCAGDTVVWENTSTKAYHEQGDKYFGKTKKGVYACKADADKAGFHLAGSKTKSSSASASSTTASPAPDAMSSTMPGAMSSPVGKKHHHHKKDMMASPAPVPSAT